VRPVAATISIDVPRERVFDLLCDLSIRPAFTDHFVTGYRLERVNPVGVGAAARFRIGDRGAWLDTAIEVAERPHTVRERGRGGRANRVEVFTVWELAEGAGPSACDVRLTLWSESAALFDRLRDPLGGSRRLRRGWSRALRRLRELAEEGGAPAAVAIAGADRPPTFVA
jgi:uncharacterized protein YndB with AHSA1/START domain